jgi:hypothetical protein
VRVIAYAVDDSESSSQALSERSSTHITRHAATSPVLI